MNVLDFAKPIEECPVCGQDLPMVGHPNGLERMVGSKRYFEDELDIDEELYYYIRDAEESPLITICLLISVDGFVARGVAVCSPMDNPEKAIGRGWARDRAYDAMYKEKSDEPIKTQIVKYIFYICDVSVPRFKQQFNPELSSFEKNVLLQKGFEY
ncbi:MAG: hypothetical protein GY938_32950 [Ketobacter sp.]|nr:hypothetical protein [Ketobacter sp.]